MVRLARPRDARRLRGGSAAIGDIRPAAEIVSSDCPALKEKSREGREVAVEILGIVRVCLWAKRGNAAGDALWLVEEVNEDPGGGMLPAVGRDGPPFA